MATEDYVLLAPPEGQRQRELWVQHAAGFILVEDVRNRALASIDPAASVEARRVAEAAVNDAVYGLMSVIDGVTGGLRGPAGVVSLRFVAQFQPSDDRAPAYQQDLFDGDGMCMAYHRWVAGEFGTHAVAVKRTSA